MPKIQITKKILTSIIDILPIGVLLVDEESKIVFANTKVESLLGFNANELNSQPVSKLIPSKLRKAHNENIAAYHSVPEERAMDGGRVLSALTKNGEEIQIQIGLTPIVISNNNYVLVSLVETMNQVLKVASFNDPLTGLPNRTLFNELSENSRNLAIRNKTCLALMFIDLDNFKLVNDRYGHDVGDLLLRKVSNVFIKSIRTNDIVSRIGGDEFLICFYGMENITDLEKISQKLRKRITSIQNINGYKVDISASVGVIYVSHPANISINEMIKKADKLMYKAKASDKGTDFIEKY